MDELTAWLSLMRVPGMHTGILRELLRHHASVCSIVTATRAELRATGAGDKLIDWLHTPCGEPLQKDLRWLQVEDHHFVPLGAQHYPPLLAEISDAPVGLFVRGDPSLLSTPQLAMVGSRNPTAAGRDTATSFAAHIARSGLAITSGLAIGIDAACHRGALDSGGITIAVCGTGLDIDYPRSNAALAREIAARGALVSEFPLGTHAAKLNFPRRNRIISALSLGTLVIEAATRSGSLITARLAAEQGREVFAIPGSIHNPLAHGCHQLIRQGAKLVETVEDIFAELHVATGGHDVMTPVAQRARAAGNFGPVLDKEYEILLDALGFEPASVDVLVARTGLGADEVASMLLILELEARIAHHPGGLYVRRVP
jgi:DNA processing protein